MLRQCERSMSESCFVLLLSLVLLHRMLSPGVIW